MIHPAIARMFTIQELKRRTIVGFLSRLRERDVIFWRRIVRFWECQIFVDYVFTVIESDPERCHVTMSPECVEHERLFPDVWIRDIVSVAFFDPGPLFFYLYE